MADMQTYRVESSIEPFYLFIYLEHANPRLKTQKALSAVYKKIHSTGTAKCQQAKMCLHHGMSEIKLHCPPFLSQMRDVTSGSCGLVGGGRRVKQGWGQKMLLE